ncbi:MAG TPA: hypothetical protein VHK26_14220 [Methyloceanibacter sp.]|jgi:hypothetical protein|nr:hypothetical protein [Methyloceanibacter sp.]
MTRIVLSALLKPFKGGVQAKAAEFPDLEVTSWTIHGAVAKLREKLSHRLRWTKIDRSCSGDPITPVPQPSEGFIAVPIELALPQRAGDVSSRP